MWSGSSSNIPSGWLLCNGSNGTPDLRDRFIVGAGSSYGVGNIGGEATHALTTAEMPSHNHTFTGASHTHTLNLSGLTCSSAGEHNHTTYIPKSSNRVTRVTSVESSNTGSGSITGDTDLAGAHTHTITGNGTLDAATAGGNIGYTGFGSAHENRPPYYALCFIMKQ